MTDDTDYHALSDDELVAQCDVDTYRASGPGGQKRNKTSSAVRLRHRPTGVLVTATESRSQHENRRRAVRRLRERLALEVRRPVDPERFCCPATVAGLFSRRHGHVARSSDQWPAAVGGLLDLFVATGCSVSETAARVGVTTGAMSRVLRSDDALARKVNELRAERDLRPLR